MSKFIIAFVYLICSANDLELVVINILLVNCKPLFFKRASKLSLSTALPKSTHKNGTYLSTNNTLNRVLYEPQKFLNLFYLNKVFK